MKGVRMNNINLLTINGQPALANKVAVITGGTRGIGFAIAQTFLKNGAKVIIFGSREESVNKALKQLEKAGFDNDNFRGYWPDLSDYQSVATTIDQIVADFAKIDILVNNAGVSAEKPTEFTEASEFDKVIDLNLNAVFRVIRAVMPVMKKRSEGVILNTSSMVSLYGQPAGVGYPASKFGINGLTKSLARELANDGIRVNAVAPGIINTDMVAKLPASVIDPLIKTIPLGRIGEPADIANAFLYLASDLASYVTGEILSVDGCARS